MSDLEIFGKRLKELRNKNGLSQRDLAAKLGVSVNTIVTYEKAQKSPTLDLAKRVSEFFGTPLDWLCGTSNSIDNTKIYCTADIIKLILRIDAAGKIDFVDICTLNGFEDWRIEIDDEEFKRFADEWRKIRELKKNGTIDEDLYNLWIEKQLSLPVYKEPYFSNDIT